MSDLGQPPRKMRADAVRNREQVLHAAKLVFSGGIHGASLEAVARHAGVGIGTLYRHFPTREALFEAVYRHEVEHLVQLAAALAAEPDPVEALRRWMHAAVEFVATKKGMSAALALAVQSTSDFVASASVRLANACALLLERAVDAGAIRADVGPHDLLLTLVGMCYTHGNAGWQVNVLRMVDVLIDGLCHRAARASP